MKITIKKKLYGGFSAILLLLIIISIMNYVASYKTNKMYSNLINQQVLTVGYIKDLHIAISEEEATLNKFLLTGDSTYLQIYEDTFDNYNHTSKKLKELLINNKAAWQVFQGLNLLQQEFIIIADEMIENQKKGSTKKIISLATEQAPLIQKFQETSEKLINMQEEILNEKIEDVKNTIRVNNNFNIIVTIFALILGFGISFAISKSISTPIMSLVNIASKIAHGDLTTEIDKVKTNDEIRTLINAFSKMSANLKVILQDVEVAAEQVAVSAEELTASTEETINASKHIATITEDLAAGEEVQSKNIKQSVQFVSNIDTKAEQIATNTQEITKMMAETSDVVLDGNLSVKKAIDQINAIQKTVTDIANTVNELGQQSNQINKITETISDIAEQTNLLSLNAGIEAARAGDYGKGFAVVALEVRKLSEETAKSSQEISRVISMILQKTDKTISAVFDSQKEVERGINAVTTAGTSFDQIQHSITDVQKTIQEVATSSMDMSQGTKELVTMFDQINEISIATAEGTQEVSASTEEQLAVTEEITSAASSLSTMSEDLLKQISMFKLK